jgi:hypothetical protein
MLLQVQLDVAGSILILGNSIFLFREGGWDREITALHMMVRSSISQVQVQCEDLLLVGEGETRLCSIFASGEEYIVITKPLQIVVAEMRWTMTEVQIVREVNSDIIASTP